MLTDLGPGVVPHQFALIQTPTSRTAFMVYYAQKYVALHHLEAAGWDTRDPVFFEQCSGARPQGAMELSWLQAHVLQGTANARLPRIPRSQVRYLPARVYVVLARNVASIIESVRPAFVSAQVGSALGVGVTSYGPVSLPMELDLTDVRARREHYTISMIVHDMPTLAQFAQAHPRSLLSQQIETFSNGGVELHFTYTPLSQGRQRRGRPRSVDMLFPLDPFRVILRAQERIVHANGRMAALI
jgi:hypothetical protein